MNALNLYNKSPIFVQNIICSLRGHRDNLLRFGGDFENYFNFLQESQFWSEEKIDSYQLENTLNIIQYSYSEIPYYRNLFKKLKLVPSDFKEISDLEKLPILEKSEVRENYDTMLNPKIEKNNIIKQHTSGSTGKALNFYMTKSAIQKRWALWYRHRLRFNVRLGDPYITFTGLPAVPLDQVKPPYWRENKPGNQTIFTMHHINARTVKCIVEKLNEDRWVYYSGYPSIIYSLASLVDQYGLVIKAKPQVIFTGAETLLNNQRELISKVFNCHVTDLYGFSEGCGNASRCEDDVYHEDFEYGYLEKREKNKVGSKVVTSELLATGFTNMAMPFIRYRVGDVLTWNGVKCTCGRHSKTIGEISGRSEDYVLTPERNRISRFDYLFKDTSNIIEAQVVQKELGSVVLKIVQGMHYDIKTEKYLIAEFARKISPTMKINFEYVDEIERENTGKFRAVKSFLS